MAIEPVHRSPLLDEALAHGGPIIVFDDVSLAFDDKEILRNVSFTLKTGHTKIFLGASGAGKSTILRLILGLLKPDAGQIFVNGERVDNMKEDDLMKVRADLGHGLPGRRAVRLADRAGKRRLQALRGVRHAARRGGSRGSRKCSGSCGLSEFIDRMPSELSGGQRRRVAIARAMTAKPRILLYDEPTTGLDPITAVTIDEEIMKLRDLEGVSSIVVTHQLRDAFYVAEHMASRENGDAAVRQVAAEEGGRGGVHHAQGRPDRVRRQRLGAPRGGHQGPVHRGIPLVTSLSRRPDQGPAHAPNTLACLVGTENRHPRGRRDRARRR